MANEAGNRTRRADALSKDRIVRAAVDILDLHGEGGLTTRSLAASLETGSGAIFHHVGSREELLRAAADLIVADVIGDITVEATPTESVRLLMLGVFDAIQAHPWAGAQLAREPWHTAVLEMFLEIGSRLQPLGVREEELFDAASTLLSYLLGIAGQLAASVHISRGTDRAAFLGAAVENWAARHSSTDSPFVRQMTRLANHDDREQFIAGLEIILNGLALGPK
jgi:AcrR family transcriptional regulator